VCGSNRHSSPTYRGRGLLPRNDKPRNPLYRNIETGETIRASEWGLQLHLDGWKEQKEYGCINPDSSDFDAPNEYPLEHYIQSGIADMDEMPDEWELVKD